MHRITRTIRPLLVALTILLGSAPAAARADNSAAWSLDAAHSRVGFTVRHLAITKVHGRFDDFEAVILADAATGRLTSVEATAKTASVNTGIEARDQHLRGDDFFNAGRFPLLRLKTEAIRWQGDRFTADVDLTLRDVTRRVIFTGELLGVRKVNFGTAELRAGYEATATINRKEFGLAFNKMAEGTALVGDDVTLVIAIEVARKL